MQEFETPNRWTQFWFAASPVARLEVVRVIAGLAITCWLLGFIGSAADYHGLAGWLIVRRWLNSIACRSKSGSRSDGRRSISCLTAWQSMHYTC